jgi:hypothetical protein
MNKQYNISEEDNLVVVDNPSLELLLFLCYFQIPFNICQTFLMV